MDPELLEFANVVGAELGLLVKLARHERSTTQDVVDAVLELPDEDVRPLLLAAIFVLGNGGVIE